MGRKVKVLSTTDGSHVKRVTPAQIKKRELAQQFAQDTPFQRQMQNATQARRQQTKVKPI